MTDGLPKGIYLIRAAADGTPHWEVKWRSHHRVPPDVKRRICQAWVELDADGRWQPRRGRPKDGAIDRDTAVLRGVAIIEELEAAFADQVSRLEDSPHSRESSGVTFRALAHDYLTCLRGERQAKPSTLRVYESMLAEPGMPHKRGPGKTKGRIMKAFGPLAPAEISRQQIRDFLAGMDGEAVQARTINTQRQLLHAIFNWALEEEIYEVESNPVARVKKRREAPPRRVQFYEVDELEQIAVAMEAGAHRGEQAPHLTFDERRIRREEDARDADLLRLAILTGLRLGELRALQWWQVDLTSRVIAVEISVSAGEITTPKSNRFRFTPLADRAVDVLRRQRDRRHFTGPKDHVFGNRSGRLLDDSSLRKRYNRAREAIGLRKLTIHELRHSAGSLFGREANAFDIRDFLGHSRVSTSDRYTHTRFDDEYFERLNRAFGDRRRGAA